MKLGDLPGYREASGARAGWGTASSIPRQGKGTAEEFLLPAGYLLHTNISDCLSWDSYRHKCAEAYLQQLHGVCGATLGADAQSAIRSSSMILQPSLSEYAGLKKGRRVRRLSNDASFTSNWVLLK